MKKQKHVRKSARGSDKKCENKLFIVKCQGGGVISKISRREDSINAQTPVTESLAPPQMTPMSGKRKV